MKFKLIILTIIGDFDVGITSFRKWIHFKFESHLIAIAHTLDY